MSDTTEAPVELLPRDDRGRFPAGVSGNPLGRPVGSKNKATLLREAIDEGLLEKIHDGKAFIAVLEAMLQKAVNGDVQAAKLILKEIAGRVDREEKGGAGNTIQVYIENFTSTTPAGEEDQ